MITHRPRAVAQLFQGHREPIRPTCCLVCRQPALVFDTDHARTMFAITGVCETCHEAIDTWAAEDDGPTL